ncbi:MAG: exodeoxyribonuclease III [Nannocystaceae bacterium]
MRVVSWNVNGLRAAVKKGLWGWMDTAGADIVGLQEVRARPEQLDPETRAPEGWHAHFFPAQRPGYSGVAIDAEGRFMLARFGRLVVASVYFPNGNGKDRDNSRVPYKLDFYRAVFDVLQRRRRAGQRVLVMGDFNTAHKEIDLARPKANVKTSGFLPEERAEMDRWIEAGWIDTLRVFDPSPGRYSWWTARGGARERNVGWRIDYVLASPSARSFLRDASISAEVMGSDHCPVGVELASAVCAR